MALSRRRSAGATNFWPGFVDAMSTLLLVIIFLLSFFVIAQFFLSREITDRDTVLERLNAQIATLREMLALETFESGDLADTMALLEAALADAEAERDAIAAELAAQGAAAGDVGARNAELAAELASERRATIDALNLVDLLNQQIAQLNNRLAVIAAALDASEDREAELQVTVGELGAQLNAALLLRVEQLQRFQSEFFAALSAILGNRPDVRVVGDRFVFETAVLFPFGSAVLTPEGITQLQGLATAIRELAAQIPPDIDWVLRVDGHTDAEGSDTTNLTLSLNRAAAVVNYLVSQGVDARNLLAAGFGESRLLDGIPANDARNRRIEFKLTER